MGVHEAPHRRGCGRQEPDPAERRHPDASARGHEMEAVPIRVYRYADRWLGGDRRAAHCAEHGASWLEQRGTKLAPGQRGGQPRQRLDGDRLRALERPGREGERDRRRAGGNAAAGGTDRGPDCRISGVRLQPHRVRDGEDRDSLRCRAAGPRAASAHEQVAQSRFRAPRDSGVRHPLLVCPGPGRPADHNVVARAPSVGRKEQSELRLPLARCRKPHVQPRARRDRWSGADPRYDGAAAGRPGADRQQSDRRERDGGCRV